MFLTVAASSFHPPPLLDHDASTTAPIGPPDWVLVDTTAYIDSRRNRTTATAFASNGLVVEVSFWFAAPPALSYFSVHCCGLGESELAREPRLVYSDEYVAIISIDFIFDSRYPGWSLRTADGEGFVIAVLSPQLLIPGSYNLRIFLSKQWRWITKSVQLESESPRTMAECHTLEIDKVITLLEEDSLGWVDLQRGILLCNVLDENPNPVVRFIPLPKPMPGNIDLKNCPSMHRDVTYINGLIKFIEIKTRKSITHCESTSGPDDIEGVQFDSDLKSDNMCIRDATDTVISHGWRAVAWVRKPSSDCWIKDCDADSNDIEINNQRHSGLPELRDSYSGKLTLKNLITATPTLSMHGNDVVVYLMSKVNICDKNAWVIAINMTRKTLEDMALFSAERTFLFSITCRPCAFYKHLDMTADNGEAGLQIKRSENSTYTTVHVGGLDPCVTEDQLRHIFTCFGKLHDMQMLVDQGSAVVKFVNRLCAENAICELSGTLVGTKYLRLSREYDPSNELRKVKQNAESSRPCPEYYGAYSCDPTARGTSMYVKSELASHGYHPHKLRRTLPYCSTDSVVLG